MYTCSLSVFRTFPLSMEKKNVRKRKFTLLIFPPPFYLNLLDIVVLFPFSSPSLSSFLLCGGRSKATAYSRCHKSSSALQRRSLDAWYVVSTDRYGDIQIHGVQQHCPCAYPYGDTETKKEAGREQEEVTCSFQLLRRWCRRSPF